MKTEHVIIIGAGPAGLATAIQLKRYGVHPLLFEREQTGGLLRNANLVENYPGFPQGISGLDLVNLFIRQAQNLSIDVTYEEVIELVYDQGIFQARTARQSYASQAGGDCYRNQTAATLRTCRYQTSFPIEYFTKYMISYKLKVNISSLWGAEMLRLIMR